MEGASDRPRGELVLRTVAMPADTNPSGDIFGGWLMAQMDLAGGMMAKQRARGRGATIAVDSMVFHQPVQVGDILSCYADIDRIGRSSLRILVQAWVIRGADNTDELVKVTEGEFTYVAIGADGRPRPVGSG